MKNSSSKTNVRHAHQPFEGNAWNSVHKTPHFSPKDAKPTMTDQIAMPPARVWDKIEKILDEQDDRRKNTNKLIVGSFQNNKGYKRKNLYVAAVASISVLAGIFWMAR